MMKHTILVSACLLGLPCRYKGDCAPKQDVIDLANHNQLIPVCPEQLGGLPTPRNPSEITCNGVTMITGEDVTLQYRRGAESALRIASLCGAEFAILKARSPACGKGKVYDGTFSGTLTTGNGIACTLLLENNIPVYTEEESEKWPL